MQTSTNITGPWTNVLPPPGTIGATTNQMWQPLTINSTVRCYRVTQLDTDGPQVLPVSPLNGSIAVSQKATLLASLGDETGINTNTISLQISTNAPVTLTDSRLRFAGGALAYTPGPNEALGLPGSNGTVRVSATDMLGNQTTNFTWSFQIALPTVLSTNILSSGGSNGLILVSTNGNYFTYSYTGPFPGLTNGQQLVNTSLQTGDTRTVLSFTNYPASHTVVGLTRPTKPAALLQLGSLSAANFTELSGPSSAAAAFGLTGAIRSQPQPRFPVSRTIDLQRVLYQDGNLLVELLRAVR